MKHNLINTALLAIAVMAFVGCKNDDSPGAGIDNKLYISAVRYTDELLVKPQIASESRELVAGIAKPVAHTISVKFRVAPDLLDYYRNAYYDPEAVLLEKEYYRIENPTTEIQAGSVTSPPVKIDFIDINQLDRETRYVLPVTIESVTGIGLLPSARSYFYIFKGAALINVVPNMVENRAWPDWSDPSPVTNMTEFTLEALIYGNAFKNTISTVMGIEGQFLIRVGDAPIPKNQLQVASTYNITSAALQLDPNRWYHIAVTFDRGAVDIYIDGEKKQSGGAGKSSVNFGVAHSDESGGKPRCFWVGYSYADDRYFDGQMSELRIWNRVLTEAEINAPTHFYEVEPDSEGLVAYWKLDDGAGAVAKDHTMYGNDLTIEKQPKWMPVSLPEIKK